MVAEPVGKIVKADSQNVADAEPAEDYVRTAGRISIAIALAGFLDSTKPAKEQKQVADADALPFEMSLRRAGLAERGSPTTTSRADSRIEIGVEMRALRPRQFPSGQV